jgi:hypothetical protein
MGGISVHNRTKSPVNVLALTRLWLPLPSCWFSGFKVIHPGQYAPFDTFTGNGVVYVWKTSEHDDKEHANTEHGNTEFWMKYGGIVSNIVHLVVTSCSAGLLDFADIVVGDTITDWVFEYIVNVALENMLDGQVQSILQAARKAIQCFGGNLLVMMRGELKGSAQGKKYEKAFVTVTHGCVSSRTIYIDEGDTGTLKLEKPELWRVWERTLWA